MFPQFRFELRTEVVINAPASVVWSVVADVESYPEWNPFLRSVETIPPSPVLAPGKDVTITFTSGDRRTERRSRAKLVRFVRDREMAWRGGLLGSSHLLEGEHAMELLAAAGSDRDGVSTRFVHRESFSGALVPFVRRRLDTVTRANFETTNVALKKRAEATMLERGRALSS